MFLYSLFFHVCPFNKNASSSYLNAETGCVYVTVVCQAQESNVKC